MEPTEQNSDQKDLEAFGQERAELTCKANVYLAYYTYKPIAKRMSSVHVAYGDFQKNLGSNFLLKVEVQFSAISPCSHAQAVSASFGTTNCFSETLLHCTDDTTLGVHVS